MSKKQTIEDRVKSLEEREQKIKLQLDSDSDEIKEKVMRVGKIALITGIVSILAYWIFNVFFGDDDEDEKPKKKSKRKKDGGGFSARITALAMPYVNKIIEGILEDEEESESKKESKEQAD